MRKYVVAFVVIFGLSVYVSHQTQRIAEQGAQQTTQASSATPTSSAQDNHAQQDEKKPKWYIQFLYRLFTWPEGVTAWAIILTLMAIAEQTKQTTRAAEAAEASVETGKDTAKRQLRAYLNVVVGIGVYQERDKNLKFEGKPLLLNAGQTPAHKVRFRVKAAILPAPLPKETILQGTKTGKDTDEGFLGAQQNATISGLVEDFCDDSEVEGIKTATGGKGLYVWGTVTYEDIFGDAHYTRFCQQLLWLPDGKVYGFYVPGKNKAT